jgi:AcrR family transcriptional regulator
MVRRTGRRPGKQDTRAQILAAAREVFAERGYDGATIRQIATGAGVDPALVHHYFGTKEELFLATVRPPVNPVDLIAKAIDGAPDQLAALLLDTFLSVWDHPVTGPGFEALVRSAVTNRLSARLLREFFATQIVRRVLTELGAHVDPATIPARATLVASQLFGLAMIRYIVKFEPLASAPRAAVVAAVAPNLQRYLTGDVPVGPIMRSPGP